ncbi:MAG: hypothetical protein HQK53_08650 [Oligoflexia bacterium]|nr:hypothetical protein [Oligoflexia bacterium]
MKKTKDEIVLFLALILLVCLNGCAGMSPKQQLGINEYAAGNYQQAVKYLEEAQKEGDDNDELYIRLSDANFKLAESEYLKNSSVGKETKFDELLNGLEVASSYIKSSLGYLSKIPDIEEDKKNSEQKNELSQKISSYISEKTAEKERVLREVSKLRDMANSNSETAFSSFNDYLIYRPALTEVEEIFLFIEDRLYKDLETGGESKFNTQQIIVAKEYFEKLKKYFPQRTRGAEGLLTIKAYENYKNGKYRDAYANLLEIKKINAASAYLLKNESVFLKDLINNELLLIKRLEEDVAKLDALLGKRGDGKSKSSKASNSKLKQNKNLLQKIVLETDTVSTKDPMKLQLLIIDSYQYLLALPGISEEQKKNFSQKIVELRSKLAQRLIVRAGQLASTVRTNPDNAYPLIWNLLHWAWSFDPVMTEKQRALVSEAKTYLQNKGDLKVLLMIKNRPELFQGGSGGVPYELESLIKKELVQTPLPSDWPKGVTFHSASDILPMDYLYSLNGPQDLGITVAGAGAGAGTGNKFLQEKLINYDVVLWVNIMENRAEEYGLDRPSYRNSRYTSGTRMVDNPAWYTAQQEYNRAQQEYNNNYQMNQQLAGQCDRIGNIFASAICQGTVSTISSSGRDSAASRLNSTPRYVQENIYNDYTYRYYKVGVNISMRLDWQYIDRMNNISLPSKLLEYKISNKEGEIYEGAQPGDVNGVKNDRINVPDLSTEKKNGQGRILSDLKEEIKSVITKEKGLRFCHRAERLLQLQSTESKQSSPPSIPPYFALYQLCQLNLAVQLPLNEQNELLNAKKMLEQFYSITAEEVKKYSLSDDELTKISSGSVGGVGASTGSGAGAASNTSGDNPFIYSFAR